MVQLDKWCQKACVYCLALKCTILNLTWKFSYGELLFLFSTTYFIFFSKKYDKVYFMFLFFLTRDPNFDSGTSYTVNINTDHVIWLLQGNHACNVEASEVQIHISLCNSLCVHPHSTICYCRLLGLWWPTFGSFQCLLAPPSLWLAWHRCHPNAHSPGPYMHFPPLQQIITWLRSHGLVRSQLIFLWQLDFSIYKS